MKVTTIIKTQSEKAGEPRKEITIKSQGVYKHQVVIVMGLLMI